MAFISISEAARRSGISRAAIRKHLKVGRIQSDRGQVDLASFEAWLASKGDVEPFTAPESPDSPEREPGIFSSLPVAELHKTSYEARLKELEYDHKSERVALIEDVAAAVGAQYARVRTRLLAMPAETAPRLFNCQTVTEVQDRLQQLIVRILEELSEDERWKEKLLERETGITRHPDEGQTAEPVAAPGPDPEPVGGTPCRAVAGNQCPDRPV